MKKRIVPNTLKGYILICISACAFGTMAVANRVACDHGADLGTLMSARFLIVTLFYVVYMRVRGLSWRVPVKQGVALVLLGLIFYSNVVLFFYKAVQYISPAVAGLILYTYPAMVGVLGHFFLGERLSLRKIVALLIVTGGCALVVGGPVGGISITGVAYAVCTALFYSIYIVGNKKVLTDVHPVVAAAYMGVCCAVYFLGFQLTQGSYTFAFNGTVFAVMLVLAFWCTIIGILCFFRGLIILGATRSSIISTVEPLFTALLAWILLGDTIRPVQWAGGACILVGVIFLRLGKSPAQEKGLSVD